MARRRSPKYTFAFIAVGLALAAFLALAWFTSLDPFLLWIAAASAVTFFLYGYDKTQAKVGGGRVPEIVLHGAALAGGFIGGWAGMYGFRHKTLHASFKIVLAIATILWIGLGYVWYFVRQ
ncbi:MAG: DUF1294 domain-containing protein [Caldilineales bacterium]|nr:DUF1294 domain-containing protein [Caldilineales bacterium]